ncbi:hypothetical protein PIB30_030481 [Stylosanthes scabra]|uniref:RING-type E3 ubiquitin transferase n=1 Tax=Stylosanthes scabra TaxID=79078 RepID=A0ABU6VCE8_9FABA|nr:hypothetical protein [Stylosanthes scabra]
MNTGIEGTEIIVQASPLRSLRFINTPSPADPGSGGNNNETTFLERFSSPVVGSRDDNREVSNNNNNGAASVIRIIEPPIEVNLNSSPPGFPASPNRLNNPMGSDIDVTNLGINNNNNRQNDVSLNLSLHPSGGEGGGSFGGGATEQAAGGNGGLTTLRNTTTTAATAAAAARRMKRTAPDYPRRELTVVGESSSRGGGGGGGGSVPQAMAAPKRRATANESAGVHISSSSSTCTCTPAPTCPLHGGSNNNTNNNNNNNSSSSSSRERNRQTTTNNNSNNNNNNGVVLGGSSSSPSAGGPVSELQQAFRSGTSFQGLQPNNHYHMVTTTTVPSNDFNFNPLINNPELDLMIIDSTIPLLGNHHHHHHLHHGDHFPPPVTSFYHHGHQCCYFDTPYPFGPVSTITHVDHLPPHRHFAASSSSSPPPPPPLPWTSVVRPRAIPSLSVTHRRGSGGGGGGSSEASNIIIRSNSPSPSYGRRGGIINYVTQNLGNSPSSSSMYSASSLSNQLLGSLVENAGSPSSGSGAAQNTVGAVPAFQHLSSVARAWIQRLNAHDETLMRASPSSATAEDPSSTRQRALRASVADTHNLPTFSADSRRLREEIRSAIEHLRSGGSVRLEELLILDYSIVLNLLDTVEEVDDESLEIIEGRRGSNPDIGLTENEILSFIGREIFQTAGEQPQNNDACSICQEDYVHGEELGRLDCSHRYHLSCIKQWLVIKNRCPACKQMGLTIIDVDDDDED